MRGRMERMNRQKHIRRSKLFWLILLGVLCYETYSLMLAFQRMEQARQQNRQLTEMKERAIKGLKK
jgi:membrane protein required for beta-lactamase induction